MQRALPSFARRGGPRAWPVALLLLRLAAWPCRAQEAVLGIYDDSAMTQTHGVMDGPSKELWLGVGAMNPPPFDGFTGAEFSIDGLQDFSLYTVEFLGEPNLVLGTLAAPADTSTGSGGINVAWPRCVPSETLIAHLTLYAATPPENQVLTVRRRLIGVEGATWSRVRLLYR